MTTSSMPEHPDWRHGLPVLGAPAVTLRELEPDDAESLLAHLSKAAICDYITPSPSTVNRYEQFVRWTHVERQAGRHLCFGIVPAGMRVPVGIIQLWALAPRFEVAEWGFVLDSAFWGTGVFPASARLVLDFAFGTMQVHRVEARAAVENQRGNGALRKLGATREGVLRRNFQCGSQYQYHDHVMWSILHDEWSVCASPVL
jgi:RimJ/RimL family protein N-acetyltransferase